MSVHEQKYAVRLSDDRTVTVSVDQRDWAAMEAQDLPGAAWVTRARFMVWNAMRRNAQYTGAWTRFNEIDGVSVEEHQGESVPSEQEAEDEQSLNPGVLATPADSSSPSPVKRAARSKKS